MIRRTPLKRSPLKRSLVAVNRKRAKPRRGPMRDPGYLLFLRCDCKCVACAILGCGARRALNPCNWASVTIDPAHGPVNGRSSKGPDNEAIPLCSHHHEEQHRVGWPAFEAKYGFSREKEAAAHYAAYLLVREADGLGADRD